ncbi:MAG: SPOR domain-containing protein [Firmicutes bacterium]|nr:SPOR domain-containing protein [Bacillota bacterium]
MRGVARKKKKGKPTNKTLDRVYLILTLAAVAGVAVFLGYIVGLYAIQAATGALNREIAREGRVAEPLVRQPAVQITRDEPVRLVEDERPKEAVSEVRQLASESSPAPVEPEPVQTKSSPPGTLYRVQVGAFSSEANARSLADELGKLGYQVLVIPGSLHRVQVGAFSQRQNAERLKGELEGKGYPAVIISSD